MSGRRKTLDEEAEEGAKKLRELLSNPAEFEKWANRTLDMSRSRRRRATRQTGKSSRVSGRRITVA
jgi:hypothetical protein